MLHGLASAFAIVQAALIGHTYALVSGVCDPKNIPCRTDSNQGRFQTTYWLWSRSMEQLLPYVLPQPL